MTERFRLWARALRVEQWTKNALVPAAWFFAAVDVCPGDAARGGRSFLAALAVAVSLSLVSSAFYLLNDLADTEADRLHPVKRNRPVAAGAIARATAVRAALVLFAAGFAYPAAAALVSPARLPVFAALLAYAVLQCLYTGFLKRIPYVDVAALAAGFVLRAVAGAAVVTTDISPWLLVCTFTLATFLAFCKRKDEMETARGSRPVLRRYRPVLLDALVLATGTASVAAYLAFTLWSRKGQAFPLLWTTSPFVLAGVVRYAYLAGARRGTGSPERILLDDRILRLILLGYGLTSFLILF